MCDQCQNVGMGGYKLGDHDAIAEVGDAVSYRQRYIHGYHNLTNPIQPEADCLIKPFDSERKRLDLQERFEL